MSISCSITSPTIHPPCGHRALRVPASHRPLWRRDRIVPGALRLTASLADIVTCVAEVLADLVPGVADVVLWVSAVDAAAGLLDVGLHVAIGALGFVHRSVSFHSVADNLAASVALTVPRPGFADQAVVRRPPIIRYTATTMTPPITATTMLSMLMPVTSATLKTVPAR